MSGIPLHAFHVSVCEIEFDQDKRQLEITHRIFLDDLEVGLSKWSNEKIDIFNPADPARLDDLIGRYLTEKNTYTANGKVVTAKYLGSEREDAVMYCYQVITDIKRLKTMKVSNATLMELYDDQTNVIHIEHSEEIKSMKLSKDESVDEVVFE